MNPKERAKKATLRVEMAYVGRRAIGRGYEAKRNPTISSSKMRMKVF